MKDRIIELVNANRGGLALMAITFVIGAITAVVCHVCNVEYITALFASQSISILSIISVSALFKLCSMKAPMGVEWGVLGMILGIFLTIIIY